MWMLPLYLHVNQKPDYDDDDVCGSHIDEAYSSWGCTSVLLAETLTLGSFVFMFL